ncbi:MAG: proteasome assembly chaperone family protein [Acidimicrobiales bacterium]
MTDQFKVKSQPEIEDALLIVGLDGWVDAGNSTAGALKALRKEVTFAPLAEFKTDDLYDLRARRPTMHLIDSVNSGISWPRIRVGHGQDTEGKDLLLLVGPEPDYRWRPFARSVVSLAKRFNVRMVIGLGSYPAPAPHTRPTQVVATATTEEIATGVGRVMGKLDIPAGATAAIELACKKADLAATGLWAQIPHYAAGFPYPAGSAALMGALGRVGDVTISSDMFDEEVAATRTRLDELVANSEEATELVRRLETIADSVGSEGDLPSGDELAAEIQRFLREQSD